MYAVAGGKRRGVCPGVYPIQPSALCHRLPLPQIGRRSRGRRATHVHEAWVRSLLYTILRHYVLNELRHRTVVYEKNYELAQETEETDESFLQIYEEQDLRSQLLLAINKLPSQKSAICKLKLRQGLSNQEIAERMHLTVATVKSHYTQAIKMLRREFVAMGINILVFIGIA